MRAGRFLIGAVIIIAAVSYLVFAGIRETSVYYLKMHEFVEKKDTLVGEVVRIAGRVQDGSVDWKAKTLDLDFVLGGLPDKDGKVVAVAEPLPVHFNGILPDMFAEGRDVIVEGVYQADDTFKAKTILTSCPSKYEPETPET